MTRRVDFTRLHLPHWAKLLLGMVPCMACSDPPSSKVVRSGAHLDVSAELAVQLSTMSQLTDRVEWDLFGASIDFDGTVLVVGAPYHDIGEHDSGAVYVFRRNDNAWELEQTLTAGTPHEDGLFGTTVALNDNTVVVGEPGKSAEFGARAVYSFSKVGPNWVEQQAVADKHGYFGKAVALSARTLVVAHENGVVAYERASNQSAWTPAWNDLNPTERFSTRAVAVSADYAAVGSALQTIGVVRPWKRDGATWRAEDLMTEANAYEFGSSLRFCGDRLVVGAPATLGNPSNLIEAVPGTVTLYKRDKDAWSKTTNLTSFPEAGLGQFGSSIACQGAWIAVGAPMAGAFATGATYLFEETMQGWQQRARVVHPSNNDLDRFGYAVALGANRLVVGTPKRGLLPGGADDAGEAYVVDYGRPKGSACSHDAECLGQHCVDSVCCDQSCDKPCHACRAELKGFGDTGECGPIVAGMDSDDECPFSKAESCGPTGWCDGAGACAMYAAGTTCRPAECVSHAEMRSPSVCDGRGSCAVSTTQECPNGLICQGSSCLNHCELDAQCQANHYCLGVACVHQRNRGLPCESTRECTNGFCSGEICCDRACTSPCEQCAPKTGICAAVPKGSLGQATCQGNLCDGVTSDCPSSCDADSDCMATHFCSRAGRCVPKRAPGERCDPDSDCLKSPCEVCRESARCVDGSCCDLTSRCLPKGATCSTNHDCASQFCVDGRCCDECSGQCEACDVTGSEGHCVSIIGNPHGLRAKCEEPVSGDPCANRICDGTTNVTCTGFVGEDTMCQARTCIDGVLQPSSFCNGNGACNVQSPKLCAPYACGADGCMETCATDADCAPTSQCSPAHICISASICNDNSRVDPSGTRYDCTPYRCHLGACLNRCAHTSDCADHFLCSPQIHQCVAILDEPMQPAGCTTIHPHRFTPHGWPYWTAIALLLLARRRHP